MMDSNDSETMAVVKTRLASTASLPGSKPSSRERNVKQAEKLKQNAHNPKQNREHNKTMNNQAQDDADIACCGRCSQTCNDGDRCIQCALCDTWYHARCEKIDDSTYEVLKKDGERPCPLIHFYCSNMCNNAASKFLGNFMKVEKEIKEMKAEVNQVVTQVKSIESGEFTEEMKTTIRDIARVEREAGETPDSKCDVAEIEERLKRKQNLIFFNIDESSAAEAKDRIEEDSKNILKVLEKIDVENCVDFEPPTRLGKKGEAPRPLKIRFNSSEACSRILKSASKLKGTKIYISRDMTPLERREWKELLEERNRKRQEALEKGIEANWVIRRGKVVNAARGERQPIKGHADSK
ncbi:hypothetical protein EGW08_007643 [Elysia chlorotica]|uniref:Zinc finger PHD-type domain-containing protein n=1 Tax=Elysia chlorotica TaxID=188477 RepID=A0A3S0ZQU2_ELYCH|nr:hypothetical protein EGW08_007643 [Elysia chlorotica]